jgi:hypothetical protein
MRDSNPHILVAHSAGDPQLPDNLADFVALDLAVSREYAQQALVALVRGYRPRAIRAAEAWRESKSAPV